MNVATAVILSGSHVPHHLVHCNVFRNPGQTAATKLEKEGREKEDLEELMQTQELLHDTRAMLAQ